MNAEAISFFTKSVILRVNFIALYTAFVADTNCWIIVIAHGDGIARSINILFVGANRGKLFYYSYL
jgi:hypothetical protein